MKWCSPYHIQPPPPLPPLLLHLCLFLLLPFWFNTHKGEDRLSHAAEWSPSHPLQRHDWCCVYTEHKADPFGFLLALIDPPMAGVQSLVQPTKPLKIAPRILHRARKPGHHSFVRRESTQAHHLEPRALPSCQGWYFASQPIPGLFVLAYHNGSPSGPVSINELGGEPLFRELIHKPTNCSLDTYKVFLGDLDLRITVAHNSHPDALPSGYGIARLPNWLEPLRLPALRSAPGWPPTFTRTLWRPLTFGRIGPSSTGSIFCNILHLSGSQMFQAPAEVGRCQSPPR